MADRPDNVVSSTTDQVALRGAAAGRVPADKLAPAVPGRRVGYAVTAGVLVAVTLGSTLPIPLYVLYEPKMGFGPLGITVVFAVYVIGTLAALLAFGDLSDHFGRKKVLAVAVGCAAVSTIIFLVATNIGELLAARVFSGAAAGFVTGSAGGRRLRPVPAGADPDGVLGLSGPDRRRHAGAAGRPGDRPQP
jgi:MFS family permease